MTSRIAEIINSYPPLAFTSHPALIAELEAEVARARAEALKEAEAKVRRMMNDDVTAAEWRKLLSAADAIAALAKEPTSDLTSPSQSAIIQGE